MFLLQDCQAIDLDAIPDPKLADLYAYWRRQRGDRTLPARTDMKPAEMFASLGRLHLLDVEGDGVYRYRIYASGVTNPDRLEMTGRTTREYPDRAFAEFVTGHLVESHAKAAPTCNRIDAEVDGKAYRYIRLILPLGAGGAVTHFLVGTQRIEVDPSLHRDALGSA